MSWSTSTEWEQWDPDLPIVCPYNPAHVIAAKRYQRHVVKCRQNNPDKDFVECPFNARHVMLRSELRHHIGHCKFRKTVDRDVALDHEKDGELYFKGNTRVPSYRNNLPEPEEDWDQELDNQGPDEENTDGYNDPQQQGPNMTQSLSSDERTNIKHLMKRKALANQTTHGALSGDGMAHSRMSQTRMDHEGHQSGEWDPSNNAGQLSGYGHTETRYDDPVPSHRLPEAFVNLNGHCEVRNTGHGPERLENTRLGDGAVFPPHGTTQQRDRFTTRSDWDWGAGMERKLNNDFDRGGVNHSGENDKQQESPRKTNLSPQNSSGMSSDSGRGRGLGSYSGIHPHVNHRAIGRGMGLLTQVSDRRPGMTPQSRGS